MKPRILQKGAYMPALDTALAQEFDVHQLWRETDQDTFLANHGSEFVGLATSARWGADAVLIARLPNLKVISSFGVGYDTIDIAAASARGIPVGNTPDVLNECVADIAFGLLIDVARGLSASERFLRRGDWKRGPFALQTRVSGKRLGILGLGRIGRAIAKRASGFDMDVRYHNRRRVDNVDFTYEPSLIELARWADFLVLASSGGPETRHLVSAEVIDALGADGFLINIARGSIVDEAALVAALVDNKIAGAALDVFENEPDVPQALLTMDNVVLLPHIASGTNETRQAMADLTVANLRSFFSSGKLVAQVI